jgi:hypothetical protein
MNEPHRRIHRSKPISLTTGDTDDILVVSAGGLGSRATVMFRGDAAWLGAAEDVLVKLFATLGGIRVKLAEVRLRDTVVTPGATSTAIVIVASGFTAEGVEVVIRRSGAGASLEDGLFLLAVGDCGLLEISAAQTVGAPPVSQGTPAADAARWPVYLSDGAGEIGGESAPVVTRAMRGTVATFVASTSSGTNRTVSSGTTAASLSLLHLWKPATSAKRIEIVRVDVSTIPATGTGHVVLHGRFTSSDGGSTGTAVTPQALDPSDGASDATARYLQTGVGVRSGSDVLAFAVPATGAATRSWSPSDLGRAIVLRPNRGEGFDVAATVVGTLSAPMFVAITITYHER